MLVAGKKYYTIERVWNDNKVNESCIPQGSYDLIPHGWNGGFKFEKVWRFVEVKGRTAILIHAGNTVEDTTGCVLVGKSVRIYEDDAFLYNSGDAIDELRKLIGENPSQIIVRNL